jgi:cyclophilin family peptidyl-prolyl cis-trans isomerase
MNTTTHILLCAAIVSLAVGQAFAQANKQPKGELLTGDHHAIIETSLGKFEVELYTADAPKTVTNFVRLAEQKFFDGQRFHRVSKNFVIQAGDDKSKDPKKKSEWGTGGKSIWGREFEDELNPSTPSYQAGYMKGVLAMANRGPNTNTSQFFVMLRDNTSLPKAYTIFGKVTKGMDVVEKIGQVEIEPQMGPTDGRPKVDVIIKKIRILHSGGAPPPAK